MVHCERDATGHRRVAEVLAVGNRVENGVIETYPVFRLENGVLRAVASEVPSSEKFVRAGYAPAALIRDDAPPSSPGMVEDGPEASAPAVEPSAPRGTGRVAEGGNQGRAGAGRARAGHRASSRGGQSRGRSS